MSFRFNPFTGTFDIVEPAGAAVTPGGADTNVQYNDGGVFGGDAAFTFNDTTLQVTLTSNTTTANLQINNTGNGPHFNLIGDPVVAAPADGDLWWNGTNLYFYNGATSTDLLAHHTGNTLDQAYDEGGAGAGRLITVDAGVVAMITPDGSNNFVLALSQNDVTNNPIALDVNNGGTGSTIDIASTGNGPHFTLKGDPTVAVPIDGDFWWTGTALNFYDGTATHDLLTEGGTLDSSYDFGGPGLGRTIDVDSGAVELTVSNTDNNVALIINQNDNTNNPNAMNIVNAGIGYCLFIDDNSGNGVAMLIDSENVNAAILRVEGDVLSGGEIAQFTSDSADNSARNLVEVINDNVLATGAVNLYLKNDGAAQCIQIVDGSEGAGKVLTSDANGVGTWVTNAAAGNTLDQAYDQGGAGVGRTITIDSGPVLLNTVNASNSIGLIVDQNDTTNNPVALRINNSGTGQGLFANQTGDGKGVFVNATGVLTSDAVHIDADALTTGTALSVTSDSADTNTRNLVEIINDNALATGTIGLSIQQDSTGPAIKLPVYGRIESDADTYISFDGSNLMSLQAGGFNMLKLIANSGGNEELVVNEDSADMDFRVETNPTGSHFVIDGADDTTSIISATTTNNTFSVTNNSLTTGKLGYFYSNSADTGSRNLVEIYNDNTASVNTYPLYVRQDAAEIAVYIDQNGASTGLYIDKGGDGNAARISANTTTSDALRVDTTSLTTGRNAYFYDNSTSTSGRNLVEIHNDNTLATGATCLYINQDADARGIQLDTDATTDNALLIQGNSMTTGTILSVVGNALTTGALATFTSDSANVSARNLVEIINDNVAADATIPLYIRNDGDEGGIQIVDGNESDGFVLTSDANGVGTWQSATTGQVLQVVNTQDAAVNTGTTTMPYDDTIPQNTEGDEYMTLAITPGNTNNLLRIEFLLNGSSTDSGNVFTYALFQDSTAGALIAGFVNPGGAQIRGKYLTYYMTAGTTSATTFKVRAGCNSSGTFTFNGEASARKFGGVGYSSITITEISA